MSIHPRMEDFGPMPAIEPARVGFWRLVAAYLRLVFSGAKGDHRARERPPADCERVSRA